MENKNCLQRPFFHVSGENFTKSPQEAFPIEGYKAPINFPNCCDFHKLVFETAQRWFDRFPNCCKYHAQALQQRNLTKSDYEGLPYKVLNGLSYTEHHIRTRIDIPEWYEDITNYIYYILWSFGHPAIGMECYCASLKQYLEGTTIKIPKYKRERLIQYVESLTKPINPNKASDFDLNAIYDTYQKWLKTFPFELPYFKGLKEKYEVKLPVIKGTVRFNPYTGLSEANMRTKAELIDFLGITTKQLIGGVQTHDFQISNLKQHRLKIENERLRVDTDELVKEYSKGELKYVTTIKRWLIIQKRYFKAVVEIAGSEPTKPLKTPPTFPGLFENNEAMNKALMAARNCGVINQKGRWIFSGAKTLAASAFWKAAVTSGLGKASMARASVSKAMGERFGITLGKNAIGTESGEFNQELYTRILAAMKST